MVLFLIFTLSIIFLTLFSLSTLKRFTCIRRTFGFVMNCLETSTSSSTLSFDLGQLCLSLYWESDLRNPSYFLNKRKELEFFIWNLVDLQYLASYVRGKVTKTIELQGKSPKYQQEYAENDFQIEKKSLFTHFRCYCQDDTFMEKFY